MRSRTKNNTSHIGWLPIIGLILGFSLLGFLVVVDIATQYQSNQAISTMTSTSSNESDPVRLEYLAQAQSYNALISNKETSTQSNELWDYDDQLTYGSRPYMGWISIPKIDVKMPIYHGADKESLAAGVGHIEGTSLPVGGESTHCVLTGHSGMMGSRMFDDLRLLGEGDMFCLYVLGTPYTYRVYEIETVLPEETDSLLISQGQDLCTLVTCTPYGINDHRLLVHAQRCEYDVEYFEDASTSAEVSNYVNIRTTPLLIGIGICVVGFIIYVTQRRRRKRQRMGEVSRQEKRRKEARKSYKGGRNV